MRAATILVAVATVAGLWTSSPMDAQEIRLAINPYLGHYGFDKSSFEKTGEFLDFDGDPIYGLRLSLGRYRGFSVDLAYGRSSVEGSLCGDGVCIGAENADIVLLYGALNYHLALPVDVFVSGGFGVIDYNPEFRDTGTDVLMNYGAGFTVPVGIARLRVDVKDQVDLCDAREDSEDFDFGACLEDETLHNLEVSAGLAFEF